MIAACERSLPKSFKLLLAFGKGLVEMDRLPDKEKQMWGRQDKEIGKGIF